MRSEPTSTTTSDPTNAASGSGWWQTVHAWFDSANHTLLTVLAIVLGALIVWVVGRLLIRGVVRGIAQGLDWSEDRARSVLARVRHSEFEEDGQWDDDLANARRATRSKTIGLVLRAGLNVVIVLITVLMILSEIGVPVTPLLASAGIAGVALGFGAQSLVKDLLSGLFMLLEDQYGVGDVIDVGDASGLVEQVGLRATRLRSLDGTVWFIPNGEIRRVGNMTQLWSRAKIEVRFDFDTDIDAARAAMLDAVAVARRDPDVAAAVLNDPEVAGVEALDYNSVTLRLLMQVKPLTQWTVMRAVREAMRDLFVERGIELAAPEGVLMERRPTAKPAKATPKRAAARKPSATPKQP